jgi:predicted nucleic acid-binding protein
MEDAMIAATAQLHDLTVVTRNVRHFDTLDVPTLDPFASV